MKRFFEIHLPVLSVVANRGSIVAMCGRPGLRRAAIARLAKSIESQGLTWERTTLDIWTRPESGKSADVVFIKSFSKPGIREAYYDLALDNIRSMFDRKLTPTKVVILECSESDERIRKAAQGHRVVLVTLTKGDFEE